MNADRPVRGAGAATGTDSVQGQVLRGRGDKFLLPAASRAIA